MLVTADQLFCHAIGDYVLQSDYMAETKTKKSIAAFMHAFSYSLCFVFLTQSTPALLLIFSSHFIIDRWRLARYICWAKNFLAPKHIEVVSVEQTDSKVKLIRNLPWKDCTATGYSPGKPLWMSVWLMIVCDNCLHVLFNAVAIKYL